VAQNLLDIDFDGGNNDYDSDMDIYNEIGSDYEGLDIKEILKSDNVAELLSEKEREAVSRIVLRGLEDDERSMHDWLKYADDAMKLTNLHRDKKHIPFKNASNIKYPLITTAVIQFGSRFLPEFIKNGDIVKYHIVGKDPTESKARRGKRQETYTNWKLLVDSPSYLDNKEKFVQQLAVVGNSFVKTWYDEVEEKVEVTCIPYDNLIVNSNIDSLLKAPRISEYRYFSKKEVIEYIRHDLFCNEEMSNLEKDSTDVEAISHEFVEQHMYLDLDNDGYPEPYICTVHVASSKLFRIVARFDKSCVQRNKKGQIKRIQPYNFYVDYHFIPSVNGSFFSLGFGTLLLDSNSAVNTILNQLINAGTLATTQGGFIGKDLKIRKEDIDVQPGDWIPVESSNGNDIKGNIVPFDYKEPSQVLFSLLQMLTQAAQNLTSTTESLTGTADTTNTSPNTLLMLIQQGLKVYSAIQKRIMRSIDREVEKIVDLMAMNLDEKEYLKVIAPDQDEIIEMYSPDGKLLDWDDDSINIIPVSDINASTEAEKLVRVSSELQVALQIQQTSPGVINMHGIASNQFDALESNNKDKLVMPPPDPNAPNPQMIDLQSKIDERGKKLDLEQQKVQLKAQEVQSKVKVNTASAINKIADATDKKDGRQLEASKQTFDQLATAAQLGVELHKTKHRLGPQNAVQTKSADEQPVQPPVPPPSQSPQGNPSGVGMAGPAAGVPQPGQGMAPPQDPMQQLAQTIPHHEVVAEMKRRGLLS